MAPIYTIRFAAEHVTAPELVNLWTPTGEYTWILRDLIVANQHPSLPSNIVVWLWRPVGGYLLLHSARDLASFASARLDLRQEILPGEWLESQSTQAPYSVMATGFRFSGTTPRVVSLPAPPVHAPPAATP